MNDEYCFLYHTVYIVSTPQPSTVTTSRRKQCTTNPSFSGKSCQIVKNPCNPNPCEKGGQCFINGTGYSCDCSMLKNVFGSQCQNEKDACTGKECPAGISCKQYSDDDANLYSQCLCPGNKVHSGTSCKEIDQDFDLAFGKNFPDDKVITSVRGFSFDFNTTGFTMSFWVAGLQFTDKPFLAMIRSDYDAAVSGDTPIIAFTSDTIFVGDKKIPLTIDLTEDHEWHFISLSIAANLHYQLVVDQITKMFLEDSTALNVTIPGEEFVFIQIGNGFCGYISQVSVWQEVMSLTTVFKLLGQPLAIKDEGKLLLGWTLYSGSDFVQMTNSSTAKVGTSVCDIPLTIATIVECPSVSFADRLPPALKNSYCPEYKVFKTDYSVHQVSYENLGVGFQGTDFSANKKTFSFGAYDVALTSTDKAGNIGVCMVRLYATPNECNETAPSMSQVTTGLDDSYQVQCPDGQELSIPSPLYGHCGKLLSYNLKHMYFRPDNIICGDTKEMQMTVTTKLIYTVGFTCDPGLAGLFKEKTNSRFVKLGENKWPDLCLTPASDSCANVDVNVTCRPAPATEVYVVIIIHSMRENQTSTFGVQATPLEVMRLSIQDADDLDFRQIANSALQKNLSTVDSQADCGTGYISFKGFCVQCGPGSYFDTAEKMCKLCDFNTYSENGGRTSCDTCSGSTVTLARGSKNMSDCVQNCSSGQYLNLTSDSCVECPKNFYQNQSGQDFCYPCRPLSGTDSTGSDSAEDCVVFCMAGMEDSGNSTCRMCLADSFKATDSFGGCSPCTGNVTSGPSRLQCNETFCQVGKSLVNGSCTDCLVGYYKGSRGNGICSMCPGNKTTPSAASINMGNCSITHCVPGFHSNESTCLPCDVGSYNSVSGSHVCTSCGWNKTTEGQASTSLSNCSINVCDKGKYRNTDNQCMPCGIGFYQDKRGETSCETCGNGTTTLQTASTNRTQCRIVCDEGLYRNDSDNSCNECAIGSYQNSTGQTGCTSCNGNYTTAGTGSKLATDCFVFCQAGYYKENRTQCTLCRKGFYTDASNQNSCQQCAKIDGFDATTLSTGSNSSTDCLPICTQGRYLDKAARKCELCPIGQYSESIGLKETCDSCPSNATTRSTGSNNRVDCDVALCQPGNYRTSGETECTPCDYGTYQPLSNVDVASCTNCVNGNTTLFKGARSQESCVVRCAAGNEYSHEGTHCKPCAVGWYRPDIDTTMACHHCPSDQTTNTKGSSSCVNTQNTPPPLRRISIVLRIVFRLVYCSNQNHLRDVLRNVIFAQIRKRAIRFPSLCQEVSFICSNLQIDIAFSCSAGRRRKRATDNKATADITMTNVPSVMEDTEASGALTSAQNVIQGAFYDWGISQNNLTQNNITVESISAPKVPCNTGSEDDGNGGCAECAVGTFFDVETKSCKPCRINTYSSERASNSCTPCQSGYKTVGMGKNASSDCQPPCTMDSTYCGITGKCINGVCACHEKYTGEKCSEFKMSGNDNMVTVAGAVGGGCGLLLLILLIVGIIVSLRTKKKARKNGMLENDPQFLYDFNQGSAVVNPAFARKTAHVVDPTMYRDEIVESNLDFYQSEESNKNDVLYSNNEHSKNGHARNGHSKHGRVRNGKRH